mgnify:CR=1 FL=1
MNIMMIMMASFMLVYWVRFFTLLTNFQQQRRRQMILWTWRFKISFNEKKKLTNWEHTRWQRQLYPLTHTHTQISIHPSLLPFNKKLEKKSKLQIHYWSQRYYHPNVKNKMQPSVIWTTTKSSIQYFQISSMHKHY